MDNKWTQAGVLAALQTGRSRWEALLAEVGDTRMTEPLRGDGWSMKDLIVHVTWYEQQLVDMLQPHLGPGPDRDWLWQFTADKRNAILFSAHRDRLLPDVRAEAQQVYAELVAAVQALTAANLRAPQRFPDMPRGWQPWQLIAHHSYEHYQEHIPGIRAWLDTFEPEAAKILPRASAAGEQQATRAGCELAADLTRWEEEGGRSCISGPGSTTRQGGG